MTTHQEIARRVAARFIAQDQDQDQAQDQQAQQNQDQQTQQALPRSGPGKAMLRRGLEMLTEAIDGDNDQQFDKAMEYLTKAKGTRPNRVNE
ncbi:MAG: hypothetical protein WC708_01005 [Lentisphaeria bacterium]|jgi:hypothetical protein